MKSFGKFSKVLVVVLVVIAVGVAVLAIWPNAVAEFLGFIFEGLGMERPEEFLDVIRGA